MAGFTRIDQFHPSTSVGDAITNDMLEIRRVLRESGFSSEIFSHHVAHGLEGGKFFVPLWVVLACFDPEWPDLKTRVA